MRVRTRLLIANIGMLSIAFASMTLFAGRQITAGLRTTYEAQLQNEVLLIARGVTVVVVDYARDTLDDAALAEAFAPYEAQTGGALRLYFTGNEVELFDGVNTVHSRAPEEEPAELEAAMGRQTVVVQRVGTDGISRLYTAAPIQWQGRPVGLLQLSVPSSRLQARIVQQWLVVAGGMLLLTAAAAFVVFASTTTMLRSLRQLEHSVGRFAAGDLQYRVPAPGRDEFGAVARAFNAMADRLQQMLERQQAFASNTSHELRTPLTTIQLRVEALRRAPVSGDPLARQYIEEIAAESARLAGLVQGLTLLARLDADRIDLGRDEIDVVRFASVLCQQMRPQAEEQRISLVLSAPEEPIHIHVHLTHLNVVFRNLLDNALKYTPEGGTVHWSLAREGEMIVHHLRDTGIGIPPEHLPHVFERFYRVDRARSRDVPGSGLGLAIVWTILQVYGGTVHITSAGSDTGTTVTVRWPLHPSRPDDR